MTYENLPNNEHVESFEDTRELPHDAAEQQQINDIIEKALEKQGGISEEDQSKITAIKESLSVLPKIEEIKEARFNTVEKFEDERVLVEKQKVLPVEKHPSRINLKGIRKWMMTLGLVGVMGGAAAKDGNVVEKDSSDSLIKTKTVSVKGVESAVKDSSDNPRIAVYTSAKTAEGAITPTGYSNSFLENEYGIKPEDLGAIAKTYGFSPENFQSDMIDYIEKTNPKILDSVLEKYGATEYGIKNNIQGHQQLKDGKIGIRDAFLMSFLKTEGGGTETIQTKPKEVPTENTLEKNNKIFTFDGADYAYLLWDMSPSMGATRETLAQDLSKNTESIPVKVIGFTNKAEFSTTASNPQEAAKLLLEKKLIDQDLELAADVLEETLSSINENGHGEIYISTDEQLQHVSEDGLNRMSKIAQEKNIGINFTVLIGGKISKLSLDDVKSIYEKNYKADVDQRMTNSRRLISLNKKNIQEYETEASSSKSSKTIKDLEQKIKTEKQELKDNEDYLKTANLVNISDFSSVNK